MKNKKVVVSPLPEALDGDKWQVAHTDGMGGCSTRHKRMMTPAGDNPRDEFVRLHEMAHARFTPKQNPASLAKRNGISVDVMQVAEDARMHALLAKNRFERNGCLTDEMATKHLDGMFDTQPNPARHIAKILMASTLTDDNRRYCDAIKRAAKGMERRKGLSPEEKFNRLAAMKLAMEGYTKAIRGAIYGKENRNELSFKKFTVEMARLFESIFPEYPDGDTDDKTLEKRLRDARIKAAGQPRDGKWGKMAGPIRPKLTSRHVPRKLGYRRRAVDSGANPVNMHRIATDGCIFSTRRKILGGALLLDASGSMSISVGDIKKFIDMVPHGTVAMYSGRKDSGCLSIIAERGKAIDYKTLNEVRDNVGEGNIVDAPALRWLATQPGKRIWVSDAQVTGIGDCQTTSMIRECIDICKKGKIARFDDIPSAVESFKRA